MATKELIIRRDIEGYLVIQFEGGGQLPEELKGIYNKMRYAEKAIADYKATKVATKPKIKRKTIKTKGEQNGKDTTSKS